MVIACLEERDWEEPRIVFTVPLPQKGPVFMSMRITDYGRDNLGIVIVDARQFLGLWRSEPNSSHREVANGSPATWLHDDKYSRAAEGFSHGRENPVPLADISYGTVTRTSVTQKWLRFGGSEHQEQIQYVAFSDGITRTIWLLTQGCLAFPVKCRMPDARELFRIAAAEGTSFHTVGELAKTATRA